MKEKINARNQEKKFDKILHGLKNTSSTLKLVTQMLTAKELFRVMQTDKEFHYIIFGSLKKLCCHVNQDFITNFNVYFVPKIPEDNEILVYFNAFCTAFGNEVDRNILKDPEFEDWKRDKDSSAIRFKTSSCEIFQNFTYSHSEYCLRNAKGRLQMRNKYKPPYGKLFHTEFVFQGNRIPTVVNDNGNLIHLHHLIDNRFFEDIFERRELCGVIKNEQGELVILMYQKAIIPHPDVTVVSYITAKNFKKYARKFKIEE